MSVQELSKETVWQLTEDDVFDIVKAINNEVDQHERSAYMKIIDEAFEFRTIGKKRSDLKRGLSIHGFKFFTFDEKTNMLTGICKRKRANKSVY